MNSPRKRDSQLADIVQRGDLTALRSLLEGTSTDVNDVDNQGRTVLMYAVLNGDPRMVESLIEFGADVASKDSGGFTALHFAAQNFEVESARLLLAAGAHVDAADQYGNTPLWHAVFNSRGRGELITFLLDAGASADQKNNAAVSPIELARSIANDNLLQFFPSVSNGTQ